MAKINVLVKCLLDLGYVEEEINQADDLEEMFNVSLVEDNFRKIGEDVSETDFMGENIKDHLKEDFICFGTQSQKMTLSFRELVYFFEAYGPVSPRNPSVLLQPRQINALLLHFCEPRYRRLSQLIVKKDLPSCPGVEFLEYVSDVYNLALAMRGGGILDYVPIKKSTYDLEREDEITLQVGEAICKVIDRGLDLQLVYFKINEGVRQFYPMMADQSPLMISNLIVRLGQPDQVESCLRTNSNYLMVTCLYYFQAMGEKIPFNLDDLALLG